MRLLVVEDERKLAQVLAAGLRAADYDVVVAATGEDGFFEVNREAFDLILLDVMLPDAAVSRSSGRCDNGVSRLPCSS